MLEYIMKRDCLEQQSDKRQSRMKLCVYVKQNEYVQYHNYFTSSWNALEDNLNYNLKMGEISHQSDVWWVPQIVTICNM